MPGGSKRGYTCAITFAKAGKNQNMRRKGLIMDPQPNASVSEDMARREPANQVTQNHVVPKQPGYLLVAWILLLLLGAFFLFASVSDLGVITFFPAIFPAKQEKKSAILEAFEEEIWLLKAS